MRPNFCHVSLAFVLTFLNFLQAVVGVSILLYSVWMFNQWDHRIPPHPPLSHSSFPFFFINSINLPAAWFIFAFMGVGIIVCCITFLGCIAAEMINGCCLCFYILLIMVLLLLEAALVGFIAIDRHWEEDLPNDPTGQLESLRSLIENNMDICKWVGIAVLVIQALSLLLALILRATISTRRADFDYEDEYVATNFDYEDEYVAINFDYEDEYVARGRSWEPLPNPQSGQPFGFSKCDYRVNHSDIWNSWMREKVIMSSRLSGKQLFPSECEAPTPTRVWAESSKPKPKATPSKRKTPQSSKSGNKTQSQRLTTPQGFHTPPLAQARFKCTTKMELSKEEMEVSAYVFHIHSDPSEILVKCEDSILMRKDFNYLLPSKPVDDKILHMVALKNTWIQKKDGYIRTWVLTPNFMHDFLDGHTCDELYAKYGKDWMRCSRYLEFIYVPCNYKGNWFLTVFSIEQESVYYLSSNTAGNIEESQKTIIDGLRQLFTNILAMDEYAYINLSKSDLKTWEFIKADGIPNMGTRTNSGLWAINFIEMDNAFHPNIIGLIDDNVVRMKTVLKLILSPFNELCGLVQSNTRSFWAKLQDDPMTS